MEKAYTSMIPLVQRIIGKGKKEKKKKEGWASSLVWYVTEQKKIKYNKNYYNLYVFNFIFIENERRREIYIDKHVREIYCTRNPFPFNFPFLHISFFCTFPQTFQGSNGTEKVETAGQYSNHIMDITITHLQEDDQKCQVCLSALPHFIFQTQFFVTCLLWIIEAYLENITGLPTVE